MATIMTLLILIATITISFIIAALPLHITVKLFGGKTNIIKTILVNLVCGIVIAIIDASLNTTASIVSFLIVIFIYREMFRLKWWKTIAVWLIQGIFIYLVYLLLGTIFLALLFI